MTDGRLHDLGFAVTSSAEVEDAYEDALMTSSVFSGR